MICERDHHILGHDIDGAVADIYREIGGHHAGDADAAGIEVSGLVQHDEPEPSATDRERSPAAIASGYAEGRAEHADTEAAEAVAAAESFILEPHEGGMGPGTAYGAPDAGNEMRAGVAALADRTPDVLRTGSHDRGHGEYDTPEAGHALAVGAIEPSVPVGDRRALDDAQALTLHILHEIAPGATATFEEYRWHGDTVLDIAVSLHGHTHHYEITADRCRVVLRDEHILEHDLVGVVDELQREGAGAEHHPGVTDAAADQVHTRGGEHASATDPRHTPAAHASGVAHAGGAPVPELLRGSHYSNDTPEAEMRRDHD